MVIRNSTKGQVHAINPLQQQRQEEHLKKRARRYQRNKKMEDSTEGNTRREDGYYLYSRCYCCEQLVKAILKCLGFESPSHGEPSQDASDSPLDSKSDTNTADQYEVKSSSTTITVQTAIRRPPITGGKGGKHN